MTRRELSFVRTAGSADDPDAQAHAFCGEVVLDAGDLAGPAFLHLPGLAGVGRVLLNGAEVHAFASMFRPAVVEVGALLRPGVNRVVIECDALTAYLDGTPRKPRARWRTRLTDEPRLRWVRTSIWGRAPGLLSGPPAVGPWRPVVLETRAAVRVSRLRLTPTLTGADGVLGVELEVSGTDAVEVRVSGSTGTVAGTVPLHDGAGSVTLTLPDVAPWWPHTHGEPSRYAVTVLHEGEPLDLPGDGTADVRSRHVGFRSLANASADSVAILVNGERVFCRGAVWTPGDLAALDRAVELGFDTVRVAGNGTYESDAFHDRCDELGLLVWQDLMFATFDYPLADPGFAAAVRAEVQAQTARLLGHPSTAVVCGSAEHEQQAAMFGVEPATGAAAELAGFLEPIVAASGLDAVWVGSSPTGGVPVTRVDTGVAQYFGVGAYLRPLSDARHARVGFAAECLAFANLADPAVEQPAPRDNGTDWDFADVREHYARLAYGPEPTLQQRQRVTGEVMAAVLGEWRRPDSGCGGGIVLQLRDSLPGAGWGLLDHEGRPKPAAHVLAPALQPVGLWFLDEGSNGLDVHLANDTADGIDLTLTVDLVLPDGRVSESAERRAHLPARGHLRLGVEELFGRFLDASYSYRFGPPPYAEVRARIDRPGPYAAASWRPANPAGSAS